jgi:hypothetical protein
MPGTVKEPTFWRRMVRLLIGPSTLRRPSDRIEGAAVALLSAVFLAAVAVAVVAGWRFCETQGAQAARLRPAEAVLTPLAPAVAAQMPATEASARWRAPDGREKSGILTTATAPGIWGSPPGTRVQVWLTSSGVPVPAPPGPAAVLLTAIVIGTAEAGGVGIALCVCYLVLRLVLDRRRLARWESDWALTGPRWTMRR